MITKEKLKTYIQNTKDDELDLAQTRSYLIEYALLHIGYHVEDYKHMKKDYITESGFGINYVYFDDEGSPIIGIEARKITENVSYNDNKYSKKLSEAINNGYLIITNGEFASLYEVNDGQTSRIDSVNIVETEGLKEIFSPESIIHQNNHYWKKYKDEKIWKRLSNNIPTYRKVIRKTLSASLNIQLKESDLDGVLRVLINKKSRDHTTRGKKAEFPSKELKTRKKAILKKFLNFLKILILAINRSHLILSEMKVIQEQNSKNFL